MLFGLIAAAALLLAGICLLPRARIAGAACLLAGLLLGLALLLIWGLRHGAVVCPACRARYTWKLPLALRQRGGYIQCPNCGAYICVDHRKTGHP